jgi:hypothetical protein
MLSHGRTSLPLTYLLVFTLSVGALFLGFYKNAWRVADQSWFDNHQRDTESFVIGRLVRSRHDGVLSSGALLG